MVYKESSWQRLVVLIQRNSFFNGTQGITSRCGLRCVRQNISHIQEVEVTSLSFIEHNVAQVRLRLDE